MSKNVTFEVDTTVTMRNIMGFDEETHKLARQNVGDTAKDAGKIMRSILRQGGHIKTRNLYRSIKNKQVIPRGVQRIKRNKGLFRTVHPRGRMGQHSHLLNAGTATRHTGNGANRGQVSGIDFQGRAWREVESSFKRRTNWMVDRNVEL